MKGRSASRKVECLVHKVTKLASRKWRKRTAVTGLPCRWPVSYCRELSSYSVPFLGADVSVVRRTQRYLHENLEQSPVSVPDLTLNKEHCVRSSPPRCLM